MKKYPRHSQEPAFQVLWATLHLASAMMHFGSAVYHFRRIRKEDDQQAVL
jgi:hypothetical protein